MSDDTTIPPAPTPTPASGLAARFGLGDALRKAFADYIEKNKIQPAGSQDLNVDLDFLKNHGGPLLAALLRGATETLMPRDLKFSVPVGGAAATPAAPAAPASPADPAPAAGSGPVNVHFDLGDFLGKLFNPPTTEPPR